MTRIGRERRCRSSPWGASLAIALCLGAAAPAIAADSLTWNKEKSRVDADIRSWPLPHLLQVITSATGWEVYVEPNTERTVTAQFEGLKPADALHRLLGNLNFALLPQVSGPSKLFVYRQSVDAATQMVARAKDRKSKPIDNELLVTVKRGSKKGIDKLTKRTGAQVVGRLDALGAYRLRFKDEEAAKKARAELAGDDETSVEANIEIAPPAVLEPLAIAQPAALPLQPDISPSADKVVVGLLDTAIQADGTLLGDFLERPVPLLGDYAPPRDAITHGTAMAETILDGVARALAERGDASRSVPLSILPIDVYGGAETTNTFDVGRGLYEALNRHVNVVNLSLGSETDSPLLQRLIGMAADNGVLVFAAAGNVAGTMPMYPAADPQAIAVTAADAQGNVAPWANRGSFVDAMAPGMNVVHFDDRAWLGSGTSFSTSWVSGWAAGYMASARQPYAPTRTQTLLRWGMPR